MIKYNVYWKNDNLNGDPTKNKFISAHDTYDEAFQSIKDWWSKNNFHPLIIRMMGDIEEQGVVLIDYGAYFQFYKIVKEEVHE